MRIKQIGIKDFRCFDKLQVDFAPEHNVHVVLAENMAGKTALMRALHVGASAYSGAILPDAALHIAPADHRVAGPNPAIDRVQASQIKVLATLTEADGSLREAVWVKYKNTQEEEFTRFLYTPALANPLAVAQRTFEAIPGSQALLPLLKAVGQTYAHSYLPLNQQIDFTGSATDGYLLCWEGTSPLPYLFACLDRLPEDGLALFQQAICSVLPDIIKVEWMREHQQPLVTFANGNVCLLEMLSDGYRYLFLLAGELATRAFLLNKHLGKGVLRQINGLVLIDEFGIHLHPGLQSDALARLQQTFPNVQFILSTQSPMLINGLAKEQIHLLDIDDDGNHSISLPAEDAIGLGAEGILLKMFGLTTTYDKQSLAWNEEYKALFKKKTTTELTEAETARFQELGGLLAGFRLDPSLQVREEDSVTRAVREQMVQREQTRTRGLDTPPVSYAELNSEVENALNSLF